MSGTSSRTASFELHEFALVLLYLLLNVLLVVLDVDQLVAHLAHYQTGAVV